MATTPPTSAPQSPTTNDPEPGLSANEAAARLGVKKQTLYAYVSRGLLRRTVSTDGRTSRFDPADLDRLHQGRRPPDDGELRTIVATAVTRVDDQGLWVRGHDLMALVDGGAGFVEIADLLWGGPPGERWPSVADESDAGVGGSGGPAATAAVGVGIGAVAGSPLDALRVITALRSARDPLRHDLSPHGVRAAGRALIVALCHDLAGGSAGEVGGAGSDRGPVADLWAALSPQAPDPARLRALDVAMALLADHGLAGSTFAARIAASVRADPYSVVSAGLGVLGGTLHGAASAGVHRLLAEVAAGEDAAEVVGRARRQLGAFPGFGHSVYRLGDPRYGALMDRLVDAWGSDPRLVHVYRVRDVISARCDEIPNVDLALGSLTYLADMAPDAGEAIFGVARIAGWLAHALEEYQEQPLRFRARERYIGPHPR